MKESKAKEFIIILTEDRIYNTNELFNRARYKIPILIKIEPSGIIDILIITDIIGCNTEQPGFVAVAKDNTDIRVTLHCGQREYTIDPAPHCPSDVENIL